MAIYGNLPNPAKYRPRRAWRMGQQDWHSYRAIFLVHVVHSGNRQFAAPRQAIVRRI
jgi:hypothetical protein